MSDDVRGFYALLRNSFKRKKNEVIVLSSIIRLFACVILLGVAVCKAVRCGSKRVNAAPLLNQEGHHKDEWQLKDHTDTTTNTMYKFRPKYFHEVKNHPLSGITLFAWLRIVIRHFFEIDWSVYWLRMIFLTVMSCINSFTATFDRCACPIP